MGDCGEGLVLTTLQSFVSQREGKDWDGGARAGTELITNVFPI